MRNNLFFVLAGLTASICLPAKSQDTSKPVIVHLTIENSSAADQDPTNQTEGQNFMRMMDGEIKTIIWMKNGKSRTEAELGFGKTLVFYDQSTQTTTTLFELMGRKMGFYTNPQEMTKMRSNLDSADAKRKAQPKQDILIEYLQDEKVIAGKTCKKAIIHYKNRKQEDQEQLVWYYPGLLLDSGIRLNELIRSAATPGLHKLKGFPMEMEMKRPNGNITKYLVTKLETDAEFKDDLLTIPSGYDILPMSEMNQGGRGRFQFMMDNN